MISSLCADASPIPLVLPTFASIKSKEQFDAALNKIRDESSPAVLCFTAAWCGPCRFISTVIEEMNRKYPHVTTYKVDIDEPTLHFIHCGKKVEEIVGADVQGLKRVMEELYSS